MFKEEINPKDIRVKLETRNFVLISNMVKNVIT